MRWFCNLGKGCAKASYTRATELYICRETYYDLCRFYSPRWKSIWRHRQRTIDRCGDWWNGCLLCRQLGPQHANVAQKMALNQDCVVLTEPIQNHRACFGRQWQYAVIGHAFACRAPWRAWRNRVRIKYYAMSSFVILICSWGVSAANTRHNWVCHAFWGAFLFGVYPYMYSSSRARVIATYNRR